MNKNAKKKNEQAIPPSQIKKKTYARPELKPCSILTDTQAIPGGNGDFRGAGNPPGAS